nr:hypothetical protein BaRGS_030756 [Batillaria attramentaria]
MLDNIEINKQQWQIVIEQEVVAAALVESDSSSSRADSTQDRNQARDSNHNASGGVDEEDDGMENEEGDRVSSEGHGEEQDTVENDINLAFHYQTDSEQQSDGSSRSLLPISEEEQLALLAKNNRRRHSMPVFVRKDLSFYLGLRRDSFPRSNFLRRQSLPATPLYLSRGSALSSGGNGKRLSVEGLSWRPKISSLSASMDTRFDHLDFMPLESQTRMLQHGSWEPGLRDSDAYLAHPHRQSASCMELRRHSQLLKQDAERLKAALGRMVKQGSLQQPELVGLASSWPSILRAGQKVANAEELKMLATHAGLLSSSDGVTDSDSASGADSISSSANNNNNVPTCLSDSQQEGVALLSRPH